MQEPTLGFGEAGHRADEGTCLFEGFLHAGSDARSKALPVLRHPDTVRVTRGVAVAKPVVDREPTSTSQPCDANPPELFEVGVVRHDPTPE